MKILHSIVAVIICSISLSAQQDSTSQTPVKVLNGRHAIGFNMFSSLEPYPGVAANYIFAFNDHLFSIAEVKLILEGEPKVRGTETEVGLGYLLSDRIIPKIGVFYHSSNMLETPIVSRVSGAFFEELELEQRRRFFGGSVGIALLLPMGNKSRLFFSMGVQYGREVIDQKVVEGAYTYVEDQIIDQRYTLNTLSEVTRPLGQTTIDLGFVFFL